MATNLYLPLPGDLISARQIQGLVNNSAQLAVATISGSYYSLDFSGDPPSFYSMASAPTLGQIVTFQAPAGDSLNELQIVGPGTSVWGPYAIVQAGGGSPIATGTIQPNDMVTLIFTGSAFQMLSGGGATGAYLPLSGGTLTGPLVPYSPGTGGGNFAIGDSAGNPTGSTGSANTWIGTSTGAANTTGYQNLALGDQAGISNTEGFANSFLGTQAGTANTTECYNTYVGAQAGQNATGSQNSFYGNYAGGAAIGGNFNCFFGVSAGENNTTDYNSFFGWDCGSANTGGTGNCFFGAGAGSVNTTGYYNSLFGFESGNSLVDGNWNALVGWQSGLALTSGTENSFLGNASGYGITIGSSCVCIGGFSGFGSGGFQASLADTTMTYVGYGSSRDGVLSNVTDVFTNSTALGYNAKVGASNQVSLGNSEVTSIVNGGGTLVSINPSGLYARQISVAASTSYDLIDGIQNGAYLLTDDNGGQCWFSVKGGAIAQNTTQAGLSDSYYVFATPSSGQIQLFISGVSLLVLTSDTLPDAVGALEVHRQ